MENSLQDITDFVNQLKMVPAELMELQYQPQSFGSWYIIVRKSGKQFRIVFDGRDSNFALQASSADKKWSEIWSCLKTDTWATEVITQLKLVSK